MHRNILIQELRWCAQQWQSTAWRLIMLQNIILVIYCKVIKTVPVKLDIFVQKDQNIQSFRVTESADIPFGVVGQKQRRWQLTN